MANLKDKFSVYSGTVTITYLHGDKPYKKQVIHNAGTTDFFRYMLLCITGQGTVLARPGYLRLFKDAQFTEEAFSFGIIYDNISDITISNNAASVTINFFVPDSLVAGKTICGYQLCGLDSSHTLYASVTEEGQAIDANTNLNVQWQLTISNKGS